MTTGLSDSDELVPPAVDTLPINFAILDGEGTIVATNRAWQAFGRANDIAVRPDTVGFNYLEVASEGDEESARRAHDRLAALLDGDVDGFDMEYPCHSPEERRWFLMQATAFEVDDARYVAVAHVDVSNRVRSERESARFERAVEAAGHAVFITDVDGTITYVNPAFERVTGYDADAALGETPAILHSEEMSDEFFERMWETILDGRQWEGKVTNRRASGERYEAHQTIAPIVEDGDVREFVAIQTDITDIEQTRRQLRALDDVLRHDLRTTLNLVQGHAETVAEEAPATSDHADAIVEATDDLLATAEKGRRLSEFLERTVTVDPVDVAERSRSVVASARDRFPEARIALEAPDTAVADAVAEFDVALEELVENAVVHHDGDRPRVEVGVETGPDRVRVTVSDTGPGIPTMEYETLDGENVTAVDHGSGFGLNVAYWVVRRSGGELLVADREPRGTDVTLRLPRG